MKSNALKLKMKFGKHGGRYYGMTHAGKEWISDGRTMMLHGFWDHAEGNVYAAFAVGKDWTFNCSFREENTAKNGMVGILERAALAVEPMTKTGFQYLEWTVYTCKEKTVLFPTKYIDPIQSYFFDEGPGLITGKLNDDVVSVTMSGTASKDKFLMDLANITWEVKTGEPSKAL